MANRNYQEYTQYSVRGNLLSVSFITKETNVVQMAP